MNPFRIRIEFWGPAKDWVNAGAVELSFVRGNGTTIGLLRDRLIEKFPRLAPGAGSLRFALNDEFVRDDDKLKDGDVVAVIPPVSGG